MPQTQGQMSLPIAPDQSALNIAAGKLSRIVDRLKAFNWRRNNKDYLAVFNWHQVTPVFDPLRHHPFTWTNLDAFEIEIEYLQTEFDILPLHEAIARLNRGDLNGANAALTFDDGDSSVAEYIVPSLLRQELPATFFINTAYLDGMTSYWFPILTYFNAHDDRAQAVGLTEDLLVEAQHLRQISDPQFYERVRTQLEQFAPYIPDLKTRLVSQGWLSELDETQFSIGAHGHEHQRFSMMPGDWQRKNLRKNVEILRQFPAYRNLFAIPFGRRHDWSEETISIARAFELEIILADGGINVGPAESIQRIPSDSRRAKHTLSQAMSKNSNG
jgi:peptidoglycan/xylan/chitin deacetylase (PgdA/CDA1 family)